LASTESGHP